MRALSWMVIFSSLAVAGCKGPLVFSCTTDAQCVRDGKSGHCEPAPTGGVSYCAFADSTCAGGERWDPTASATLSGTCAPSLLSGVDASMGLDMSVVDLMPPAPDLELAPVKWSVLGSGATNDFYSIGGTGSLDIYAVGPAGIYHSIDDGATWKSQKVPSNAGNLTSIFAASTTDVYVVGEEGTVLHSVDHGVTWTQVSVGSTENFYAVWGPPDHSAVFIAAGDGLVFKYSSITKVWKSIDTGGSQLDLTTVWGSGPLDIYVGGVDGVILHSTDLGESYTPQTTGTGQEISSIWGSSKTDIYATAGDQSVLHSTGTGGWSTVKMGSTNMNASGYGTWGSGPNDVFSTASAGGLFHSTDGGSTWPAEMAGTTSDLVGIWGTGPSDIFVAGGFGVILHGTR